MDKIDILVVMVVMKQVETEWSEPLISTQKKYQPLKVCVEHRELNALYIHWFTPLPEGMRVMDCWEMQRPKTY